MESSSKTSPGGKIGLAEVAKVDEPEKTGKLSREFCKHRFPPRSSHFIYADKA